MIVVTFLAFVVLYDHFLNLFILEDQIIFLYSQFVRKFDVGCRLNVFERGIFKHGIIVLYFVAIQ